jgi:type I restriction enzyme S subunit
MSWESKSLDQLGYVSRGRSRHRPRDAAHLYGGPYPFIQTGDVKHAGLYVKEYSHTYSEEGLAQSKLWESGTLCITIAANIADTAILGIDACYTR